MVGMERRVKSTLQRFSCVDSRRALPYGCAATKIVCTTKWAMILRSPAENENGGISFHMVPFSTRHSRARGNPGLLRRISLDTRFRGYDGTQAGLFVLIPKRVFSKEVTKFRIKGVRILRGTAGRSKVKGELMKLDQRFFDCQILFVDSSTVDGKLPRRRGGARSLWFIFLS